MQNHDPHATDPAQENSADNSVNADLDALTVRLAALESELSQARETVLRERAEIENQRRRLQRDLDQELVDYKGFTRYRDAMVAWLSQYDDGTPVDESLQQ